MQDEKITPIIGITLILFGYFSYIFFNDINSSRIMYVLSLHISLAFYSLVIFSSVSWEYLANKTLWLTVMILEVISAIEFSFYQLILDFDMGYANVIFDSTIYRSMSAIVNETYFNSLILLFSVLFAFTLALVFVKRFYAQKSGMLNSRDVFLLFKKPSNILQFFVAVFTPAGCQQYKIYCGRNDKVYEFDSDKKVLVSKRYSAEKVYKDYVIFRASIGGHRDVKKLDSLLGCKYKLFKFDCGVFKRYPFI